MDMAPAAVLAATAAVSNGKGRLSSSLDDAFFNDDDDGNDGNGEPQHKKAAF